MDINDKIKKLSEEDKSKFGKELKDSLCDRYWCATYEIDYLNPNILKAKEKLYDELFKD